MLNLRCFQGLLLHIDDGLHPVDVNALVGWQVIPNVNGKQAIESLLSKAMRDLLIDFALASVFGSQRLSSHLPETGCFGH